MGRHGGQAESVVDDLFELLARGKVLDAFEADDGASVETIDVGLAWLHEAVGGEDNGAGEDGELSALQLPRTTKVPCKAGEAVDFRAGAGGEQFSVGEDVDAAPLCGLAQLVKVEQDAAGNQDAR